MGKMALRSMVKIKGILSGLGLSAGGDINGDGQSDFLIGAQGYNSNTGRSYVIWGGKSVGDNGLIALSALNSIQGAKFDGEAVGDSLGMSISNLGDTNQDGYGDFIIGASQHNNYAGRNYVVYGGSQIGSGGLLSLSALNGTNGFKIDGEANSVYSGFCVRTAGDINGDHRPDIFVSEAYYNAQIGRSFVLYSGNGLGSNGDVSLLGLSVANGFKMDGESAGDDSGYWLYPLGDINNDGYPDLIISAFGHSTLAGRSYVVFGVPGLGSNGQINLGSLNGNNGFFLDGEVARDISGISSVGLGDINGDGYSDIFIGAPGHNSSVGRSYVVFGNSTVGSTGLIPLSTLNGINGFKLDGEAANDASGSWSGLPAI